MKKGTLQRLQNKTGIFDKEWKEGHFESGDQGKKLLEIRTFEKRLMIKNLYIWGFGERILHRGKFKPIPSGKIKFQLYEKQRCSSCGWSLVNHE